MERLTTKREWKEAKDDLANEYGYSHIWNRLREIEDILGDNYDLYRLRELVEADREGRCHVIVPSGQEDGPSRYDPVGPSGNPGVPVIGEMVWIIEPYEDDEPEVTGYVLIGMNDKYAFLSPKVNDETDPYDLCVYYYGCFYDYAEAEGIAVWPINECYLSKEAAEAVLKGDQYDIQGI